jgi:uncharacterized protein (TIGR02284 family)
MSARVPQSIYNDLIRRSIDLRRLYRHAASICEPGLRMVLGENAQTLDLLIADMQEPLLADGGSLRKRGSWLGTLRRRTTGLLLRAAPHRDHAWIHALAHQESALLRAFEQAIAVVPAESKPDLRRQLPRLRNIHLDMHNLGGTARY